MTWTEWSGKVVMRMDRILGEQGKLYPRDYTLDDLQKAEAQALVELKREHNAS
jgi:hypothetical protein